MTPPLIVTLAFVAGLVPALLAPLALLPLAAFGALAALLALRVTRQARAAALLFACLGAGAGLLAAQRAAHVCAARWAHGERVLLRGHVAAVPAEQGAVTFVPRGPCGEPLRVLLPRGRTVSAGEPVIVSGRWQRLEPLRRWPVPAARAGVLRVEQVRAVGGGGAGTLVRARIRAQHALRATLPERHPAAEALVLAQRDALDPAVRDAFVNAGMAHLLAISGSHVLIFAGVVLLLLRVLRVPLRIGRVAAVIVIVLYVLALGAPPPAARAALQFALVTAALLLQRPAHGWSVIAAVALLLLVLEPLNALDVGFQLSFAGVCGLLAYRRRLSDALPRRIPAFLRAELATGIAATLATAPIAALHFGQFAPVGLLASIVAAPLLAFALPAIALLLALHALAPPAAILLGPGVELLLGALMRVANAAAAVPGGHVAVSALTLAVTLALALALLLWRGRARDAGPAAPEPATPLEHRRRQRRRLLASLRLAALALAVLSWAPTALPDTRTIEIHVIDVGQGDAIAIRTPAHRWILVDAGMRTDRSDMGQRRVVPYLLRLGVRRIDLLVLTHPHADHIGGALAVLRAFDVGTVIDPGAPVPSAQLVQTLRAAAAEPARWVAPRPGAELRLDGVSLRFLHPLAPSLDAPEDPNDLSVVFRLAYGRFAALFTGDATAYVEERLLKRYGNDLAAAVLKVGHHGSRTSSQADFLDAVDARVALVSVGRDNRYGHPSPEVLARLLRAGARVLRTDERGSIRLRAWRTGELEIASQR